MHTIPESHNNKDRKSKEKQYPTMPKKKILETKIKQSNSKAFACDAMTKNAAAIIRNGIARVQNATCANDKNIRNQQFKEKRRIQTR